MKDDSFKMIRAADSLSKQTPAFIGVHVDYFEEDNDSYDIKLIIHISLVQFLLVSDTTHVHVSI